VPQMDLNMKQKKKFSAVNMH